MKNYILPLIVALFVVGCSQPEASTAPASGTGTGTVASLEKCPECGKEFPASEMIAHGSTKICKECEKLHGH